MLGIGNLIIVYCDYGRLGNRLHTHANAMAWCIENNYNLINLSFCKYADLFEHSPNHYFGSISKRTYFIFKILSSNALRNFLKRLLLSDKWLKRIPCLIYLIRPSKTEILEESDLKIQIKQKKINLIKNWDIRCSNSLKINQNKIRSYLGPKKKFRSTAEKIINELKSKYDCLVSIHVRRGDYATYLDGLHYHSWESYIKWGNQTKELLQRSGKKKVGFVICSDEVPPSSVPNNEIFFYSSSKEIMVDIHLLSLCDYNIGPPSSFGTWISWFGKVPRFDVLSNTEITSLEQFKICNTC